jgi:hypothetical protein
MFIAIVPNGTRHVNGKHIVLYKYYRIVLSERKEKKTS